MRALCSLVLIAGCSHSAVVVNNAQPNAPVSGVAGSGTVAVVVLIGTAAIAATQQASNPAWSSQPVPTMAADRDVVEQDCTKPVDLGGNLRCR